MGAYFPVTDPVVVIAIVTAIIVASPLLLERYRIPGMIGVLLAGALLGPNALGILARDQAIVLLGTMGLLYIMFFAALEIDLAVFKRSRMQSITFGVLTFAIPMGLGVTMGRFLFGMEWPAAVLLASLFASHTLLAYPIVSRLGLAKNSAVTTALGGTIFTDTAALLVLAVVASSAQGELTRELWLKLGASMLAYVLGVLVIVPRVARWFFRNVRPDGPAEFAFVLAVVFTTASLSHAAGVEPIVGAFLAGLALNRSILHGGTLMNRIQFTGEAIFVPFFLLSVGMLLDVRVFLAGFRSWYISIGMVACVVVAKFLAARLATLVFGYDRHENGIVFGLSLAQAAATLAAVMVGHNIGLFDDAVVNGAIVMMLVTCTVAPWLVDRHGRELALAQQEKVAGGEHALQRIMIGLSNAKTAQPLVDMALLLRDGAQQQPVYPLAVVRDGDDVMSAVAYSEKMLSRAVIHLTSADVPSQAVTRIDMNVAAAVRRARKELRITDVIMGWSDKPSAQERFFGSVLEHLLEERDYALWVCRLLHPLNTTSRVLFLVPPNAVHERGFARAAGEVKHLAGHVGTQLVVWAQRSDASAVTSCLRGIKSPVEERVQEIESWASLMQSLTGQVSDLDLVVIYGAREGGLAWSPSVARLPRRLAGHLGGTNLIVLYPAEAERGQELVERSAAQQPVVPALVRQERIVLGLDNLSLRDAVATMLEEGLAGAGHERSEHLVESLMSSLQELTPGVALLHASSRRMTESAVVIGISRAGLASKAGAPLRLLVVLLHPTERDPQGHLDTLADIARLVREPTRVEQMCRAETVAQVWSALHRAHGSRVLTEAEDAAPPSDAGA